MSYKLFSAAFVYTITAIAAVELLSLDTAFFPALANVIFFIVSAAVVALTIYKLEYGLYLLLAELFIGGKGQLLVLELGGVDLSIRMMLFLIILGVWLARLPHYYPTLTKISTQLIYAYAALGAVIMLGLVNGLLRNEFINVIFDFNAWLFFILLPVVVSAIQKKHLEALFGVFMAATSYLTLKTMVTLLLFSHGIFTIGSPFYSWIRDSGVGEITYVSGSIFRVFFQSQLYLLVGFFALFAWALWPGHRLSKKQWWFIIPYLYLTSFALLVSQSRSFWVGGGAALAILLIFIWYQYRFRIAKIVIVLGSLTMMVVSQIMLLNVMTGNFYGNVIGERFKHLSNEAASISRLNQLKPLVSEILPQFLIGHGFGKTITYQSSDPRIRKNSPDGSYTTYAFEWGYLDLMLKLGTIGLLAYGAVIVTISAFGIKKMPRDPALIIGTLTGLIAILMTNIFSPYLNHPLGIGYVLLLTSLYQKI